MVLSLGPTVMDSPQAVEPITENDIADFLVRTPGFFERHAELLAGVRLAHPHGQRVISLQQRQVELLRRRIHDLEFSAASLIHNGLDNVVIADRLQRWTEGLLRTPEVAARPALVVEGLKAEFGLPEAELRLWGLAPEFASLAGAEGGGEALRAGAAALRRPYCGPSQGQNVPAWLEPPVAAGSMALVPLRTGDVAFGLLLLASPDPQRFQTSMDTDFLRRLGELAVAALSCLLPPSS